MLNEVQITEKLVSSKGLMPLSQPLVRINIFNKRETCNVHFHQSYKYIYLATALFWRYVIPLKI